MKASSRLFSGAAAVLLVIMATGANCPSACKHRLAGFFFPTNNPNEIGNAVFLDPKCSAATLIVVGSAKCQPLKGAWFDRTQEFAARKSRRELRSAQVRFAPLACGRLLAWPDRFREKAEKTEERAT